MKPEPPPGYQYFYFYRPVEGGGRQRWRLTVDWEMNITAEDPCGQDGMPGPPEPSAAPHALNAYSRELRERGIDFHVAHGGIPDGEGIPKSEVMAIQFFMPELPCPDFPGCEDLRKRYLEEKDALCSGCNLGGLHRKYRPLVRRAIGDAPGG